MKLFRIFALSVLCMGMATGIARAEVPEGTKIDAALVSNLMSWIEKETGYHAPNQPSVVASQEKFRMVMNMNGVHYADARAMYIPGMVILDNEAWEADDPVQISLLVHELVHHAQLFSKRKYACAEAKEYEAYIIQNKWLEAHDARPFASQAWIDEMSQCSNS